MLEVDSSIELDFSDIFARYDLAASMALEDTADALLTEIKNAETMPFDTGNMQNENTFVDNSASSEGIVTLVTSTPYARRLYYHPEYNFSREEHIAAGAYWLDPWLHGGTRQNFCSEKFEQFYKRLCNKLC